MKIIAILASCVLICSLLLNFLPVNGEEAIYSDTVRLHIKAASDSKEDQDLKLKVRDRVLDVLDEKMGSANSCDEAVELVECSLDKIKENAEDVLRENGRDFDVTVSLEHEKFPERKYDSFTLPAGTYRSLRVDIGKAEGHNWWCVLFPSVCTSDALRAEEKYAEAGFTPEQYRIIENGKSGKYKVRFKILEILAGIFS